MQTKKIGLFRKMMYGVAEFPGTLIISLVNFFLLIFLTDYLGVSPIWAGVVVFVGVIFDAIIDPYIGYISDKNKSKYGRRRIFMIIFAIPTGIAFMLLFCLPQVFIQSGEAVKVIVVMLLYLLYALLLSLYRIPYGAASSDMTDDYDDRTSLAAFRTTFIIIATLVSIIVPDILGLSKLNSESGHGLLLLGIILGIVIAITGVIGVLGVKERPLAKESQVEKFSFKKYFLDSWKVKPFRQACLNFLFTNICITTINAALMYFLTYFLELPKLFLPIGGGVVVMAMLFIPLWSKLCKKIGKKQAQTLGAICMIVGLVSLIFAPGQGLEEIGDKTRVSMDMIESLGLFPWWGYISVVLIALGFGSFEMIPYTILPDAINFCNEDKIKDEGAYYGVVSFVFNLGKSIPSLVIGAVLQLTNYANPPQGGFGEGVKDMIMTQNEATRWGIIAFFVVLPSLCALISILIMKNYKISREALQQKVEKTNEEV